MIAQERYNVIEKMLEDNKIVQVSTLMKEFNVSIETVRRDLAHLEKHGVLKRVHGGAIKETIISRESEIKEREAEYWREKSQIGSYVCNLLSEGETIAMDSGTTNHAISKVIKERFSKITILTNYLPIITELSDSNFNIVSTGGVLQSNAKSFVGKIAENNIDMFHVDKAFITISGISLVDGFTDFGFNEIAIKKKLMSKAANIYIVADSSKFGIISLMKVCDFDNITAIITDSSLPTTIKAEFEKKGIKIINS